MFLEFFSGFLSAPRGLGPSSAEGQSPKATAAAGDRIYENLWKRALDIVGALGGILFFLPLFVIVYLLVRMDGGPAIFAHSRVGRDGTPFKCYKFRSMVNDADRRLAEHLARDPAARQEWEQHFKLTNDPRITAVGKVLRKTSLDELPQLWNVLKGDMSLVGPRPIVTDERVRYGEHIGCYYSCRPGITGLWQVSGRNDIDYESRVKLDAQYVKNWSLFLDVVIILRTVGIVVTRKGAY
jgi:undecaprenyl-phosphate galactose phosphotransferase